MSKIKRNLYSQLKEQRGSIIGCYTYCKTDKDLSGNRVAIKNLDAFEDTYEDSKHNVGLRFVMSIDKETSYDDIEVLMNKRAITIPESQGSNRSEISTYIFSFDNDYEKLHMRFSMRKENIKMSDNTFTAMSKLTNVIENNCSKYCITYKLSKNEGILSNNILHGRNSFKDDKVQRKLLRIRSYERL